MAAVASDGAVRGGGVVAAGGGGVAGGGGGVAEPELALSRGTRNMDTTSKLGTGIWFSH